jgi:hypothetical protein
MLPIRARGIASKAPCSQFAQTVRILLDVIPKLMGEGEGYYSCDTLLRRVAHEAGG